MASCAATTIAARCSGSADATATAVARGATTSRSTSRPANRSTVYELLSAPVSPFEIVLADSVAAGGRFRIEPEAGVDYLARLRREGDTVWLGLYSRPHGSEQEFTPLADAPAAKHADDVCPHARWARIDFETPAISAPNRERTSPTLRNELLHEQRQLEAFGS